MKNLGLTIDAIQYIEDHFLKEKIELEDVADALHYSKYHLHRIFSMTVGLTIHEYAIRRKLTEAAKLLVFSKKSIMDISIIAGYESQQSFTNAFKAMYKYSPHKFRKNEVFYPLQLKYDFKDNVDSISSLKNNPKRKIKFAKESDIPMWMDLLHLSVDGFPYLDEKEHKNTLKQYINKKSAILMFEEDVAIGSMMINYESGSIDFLAVHPLYKKRGVSKEFLNVAITELLEDREISYNYI